eukprot:21733_1
MKRKFIHNMNTPRKKRKYNVNDVNNASNNNNNSNNTKMVCVICLSEMPSQSLHEHYSKYHNELLVSTTSKFSNVIQKCNDLYNNNNNTDNEELDIKQKKKLYGDKDKFRLKLDLLHKNRHKNPDKNRDKNRHKNRHKNKTKIKNKKIEFNVPRFELNNMKNMNNNKEEKLTEFFNKLIPNIGTSVDSLILDNSMNGINNNSNNDNNNNNNNNNKYKSIINSLIGFDTNKHELSYLLSNVEKLNISNSEYKLLIKILFEQLWNARIICDEQILYIKYINMIDIGNRMQISFMLNQLKLNYN